MRVLRPVPGLPWSSPWHLESSLGVLSTLRGLTSTLRGPAGSIQPPFTRLGLAAARASGLSDRQINIQILSKQ